MAPGGGDDDPPHEQGCSLLCHYIREMTLGPATSHPRLPPGYPRPLHRLLPTRQTLLTPSYYPTPTVVHELVGSGAGTFPGPDRLRTELYKPVPDNLPQALTDAIEKGLQKCEIYCLLHRD